MSAELASQIYIKINGALVTDVVMGNVMEVVVDQHVRVPTMFTLRFQDADLNFVEGQHINLTDVVEIGALKSSGEPVRMVVGEVTALEPDFTSQRIAQLVVRGYDRSHRLHRYCHNRAFINVRDSDLAQRLADEAGLQAQVTSTSIIYEHIYQHHQTDWSLLQERAWRVGYDCFVADNTLYFQPTTLSNSADATLTWGENNLEVRPRMTLRDQVDEVIVRGWDAATQQPIVGRSNAGTLAPSIGESQNGSSWSTPFGTGSMLVVDQAVASQSEADLLAAARMTEVSSTFITVEGSVFRQPAVQAGRTVALDGLGSRFSGTYLVTQATHIYTRLSGLQTCFTVQGLRDGMLHDALGEPPQQRWSGIVSAVVTNNNDPLGQGRVKVKYPWLSEETESNWMRAASSGGMTSVPAVTDEVLVGFEQGDFNRPYLLGKLPPITSTTDTQSTSNGTTPSDPSQVMTFSSSSGHAVVLNDTQQAALELISSGGHRIALDDANRQITLTTAQGLSITLDDSTQQITLHSAGQMQLSTAASLDLNAGGNINIKADGQVNVQGTVINLN